MRKATTTQKLQQAITNNLLIVGKAEAYYKTSGNTETVNIELFKESFGFLCKSGIFSDALGWHYERDFKTNGYICEVGRMNPDSEVIFSIYLRANDGVNVEEIERILKIEEE